MLYFYPVINWYSVIINSIWIIGLAILLAAFSFHYWIASQEKIHLKEQLSLPVFQIYFWFSFTLIGIGLAGTSQKTWEIIIWIIFTLYSLVNTIKSKQ